ncbi:MAG TPA: hypothetical protein VFJ19_13540 [Nocardioidaceae bacterium]|nr:hypothetical protein [Nocardioidaceae bacterium]
MRRAAILSAGSLPVGWGGYLLLMYPPPPLEYAVGFVVAAITSATVYVLISVAGPNWSRPGGMARDLSVVPWQLLRGYLRVVAAGLAVHHGRVRGEFRREPARGIGRDDSTAEAGRAWRGWAGSLGPDRIVCGFPDDDTVLVHALVSGPGRAEAAK